MFELSRTLLLTDSGTVAEEVQAQQGFEIIATMNPGGDYGKKEVNGCSEGGYFNIKFTIEVIR